MNILGLNAFHGDAAACLLCDGDLVAAAEEERFRRVKHWAGFPSAAIAYCLRAGGIALDAIDRVAVNQDSKANLAGKIAFALKRRPDLALIAERIRNRRERAGIDRHLQAAFPDSAWPGEVHAVEHHRAHLASAFYASRFDQAVVVSIDGFGDFASGAWGVGRGTRIEVGDRVHFPHSLGLFYQALTQYLGFRRYGDEYKVMGLAAYGEPAHVGAMRKLVRADGDLGYRLDLDYFRHAREKIDYEWEEGAPSVGTLYTPALERLLGPARDPEAPLEQRHRDIARSVQAVYEEAFLRMLRGLHAQYLIDDVAIAGGCALNSVANGKVLEQTPFKRIYVPAAAGDAGGAIGAAYSVWHERGGARVSPMDHAYVGPEFGDTELRALVGRHFTKLTDLGCTVDRAPADEAICVRAALAIARGDVVGWFQGRMEWGPRALGNRSILCDPRRTDMKDIVNARIKRRESFRPFAPSILREAMPEWFEADADVPFMSQALTVRADKRALIPAVTHVDGTARLQTVSREANPLFRLLIESFRDATGIPLVLNTSFNENEPIVCDPQQALDCFLRTDMDLLVLGRFAIARVR